MKAGGGGGRWLRKLVDKIGRWIKPVHRIKSHCTWSAESIEGDGYNIYH